jgi:hypothetical protein
MGKTATNEVTGTIAGPSRELQGRAGGDDDLRRVIAAWGTLPEPLKRAVMALISGVAAFFADRQFAPSIGSIDTIEQAPLDAQGRLALARVSLDILQKNCPTNAWSGGSISAIQRQPRPLTRICVR